MILDKNAQKRISKKMSYVLRHRPDVFDLEMDVQGWVTVSALLEGFHNSKSPVTIEELTEVVELNPKQRFEFSEDGESIRARQGHSLDNLDLGYTPATPPEILFHGTPSRNQEVIEAEGLKKMNRHHVHLSPDLETAMVVGSRQTKRCIIFEIQASVMSEAGHTFYKTENDVWLVDVVPAEFLMIHIKN